MLVGDSGQVSGMTGIGDLISSGASLRFSQGFVRNLQLYAQRSNSRAWWTGQGDVSPDNAAEHPGTGPGERTV